MKALVIQKPKVVRVENVPDPRIKQASDAIIKVTSTAICGSDLHVYNGYFPQKGPLVPGHEFMGIVEEVGPRVAKLKKGDRVVVPFSIACGQCYFCERGLPAHCERSNPDHFGPEGDGLQVGGGLYGGGDLHGGYGGGQAEYVRVPFADIGPRKVPDGWPDEKALFLSDIIPTGWSAARWCNLQGGETVAVFGCGPVGLMAQKSALLQGAERVIAVDILPYRLDLAERIASAETVNAASADPVELIRDLTGGRGADACIDAVGLEAEHGLLESLSSALRVEVGTMKVLRSCLRAVRRGGTVSIVGMYGANASEFPLGMVFDKSLTLRAGPAPVHERMDELMMLVNDGRITAEDIVTHKLPLAEGPWGYELFNDKRENCVKVVLNP